MDESQLLPFSMLSYSFPSSSKMRSSSSILFSPSLSFPSALFESLSHSSRWCGYSKLLSNRFPFRLTHYPFKKDDTVEFVSIHFTDRAVIVLGIESARVSIIVELVNTMQWLTQCVISRKEQAMINNEKRKIISAAL